MKHTSNCLDQQIDLEKEFCVLYILDTDLSIYDPLSACTGSFIRKLYE